jgi:A/G-specific adenine glycosylase
VANTQRVLARWLAWGEDLKSAASQGRLWRAAERLVPPERPGAFNQGFMELGAVVCTPRSPSCLVCPVAVDCQARDRGLQDSLPVVAGRAAPIDVAEACALVVRDGRILVVQRGPAGLWAGFWEFPTIHLSGADPAARSFGEAVDLAEGVRRLTGVEARVGPAVKTVRFGVTKHRVTLSAHGAVCLSGDPTPGPGLARVAWERPEALADRPFGKAGRQLLAWLGAGGLGRLDGGP